MNKRSRLTLRDMIMARSSVPTTHIDRQRSDVSRGNTQRAATQILRLVGPPTASRSSFLNTASQESTIGGYGFYDLDQPIIASRISRLSAPLLRSVLRCRCRYSIHHSRQLRRMTIGQRRGSRIRPRFQFDSVHITKVLQPEHSNRSRQTQNTRLHAHLVAVLARRFLGSQSVGATWWNAGQETRSRIHGKRRASQQW